MQCKCRWPRGCSHDSQSAYQINPGFNLQWGKIWKNFAARENLKEFATQITQTVVCMIVLVWWSQMCYPIKHRYKQVTIKPTHIVLCSQDYTLFTAECRERLKKKNWNVFSSTPPHWEGLSDWHNGVAELKVQQLIDDIAGTDHLTQW